MPSIQMLQFFWPALQAWSPFAALMRWLWEQSPQSVSMHVARTSEAIYSFGRSLSLSVETAVHSVGAGGRVSIELQILTCPPLDAQLLLLRLVSVVVDDALERSLAPNVAGSLRIWLDTTRDELRLVVEDDGWVHRSPNSWQSHNQIAHKLVQAGGGRIHRDIEWDCNRVTVVFPI